MNCVYCGKELPEGAAFCPFCGKQTEPAEPQPSIDIVTESTGGSMPAGDPEREAPRGGQEERPETGAAGQTAPPAEDRPGNDAPGLFGAGAASPQTERTVAMPPQDEPPAPPDTAEEPIDTAAAVMTDEQTAPHGEAQTADTQPPAPAKPKKPLSKAKLFLIGGIALAVILAAVLIPVLLHNAKQSRYNEGVTLIENGEYAAAAEILQSLGSFDDAPEMAEYAKKGLAYADAKALMDAGSFAEAKELFEQAGGFKDAAEMAAQCRSALAYEEGQKLYAAGDYERAREAFSSAGDYKDARAMTEKCGAQADYAKALELMENGDYAAAAELLSALPTDGFDDLEELIAECENMPKYLEAEAALKDGRKYEAYQLFTALGSFRDAAQQAEKCKEAAPSTGETYRNGAYKGTACSLTIKPPTSDGTSTYFKIYTQDGKTLVSCVFINKGGQTTVKLPAGSYTFKAAYGRGDWFGEKDMFGDKGTYERLKSSGTSEVFTLQKNYVYTLTLRSSRSTGGDTVTTNKENRDAF